MAWQCLIDAATLRQAMAAAERSWLLVDCRASLQDPEAGRRAYREGHLPGAWHADLERDLSAPGDPRQGRHPLPEAAAFAALLAGWGLSPAHQVVAYDADGGVYAARLWWMLRLLGHRDVAVLDGGLSAWLEVGGALQTAVPVPVAEAAPLPGHFDAQAWVDAEGVVEALASGGMLLDARAAARFRGEVEPIDARAGHVPGARNRPLQLNLDQHGRFLPAPELARQFRALLGTLPAQAVVHMCGSGVSACHNLLAMEHAGLPGSRLYVGSWSQWIADPARPLACGPEGSGEQPLA